MKPEVTAEIMLSSWLQSNGVQVWYNRKIKELNNQNIFKVQGQSRKKPDMIIYSQILNKYGAIEIKPGLISKEIYDATKIIEYQRNYKEGKTKYYLEGKEINIDFFMIATRHSVNGHLFENESKEIPKEEWLKTLLKIRTEPLIEYNKTKQFLRQLWSSWRKEREKYEPGVGILLSSCLDSVESRPKIFYQTYENNRWNVRWRKI